MKDFLKKNFALLLAFVLPILLLIVLAIITYFPSFLIKTKYNFIYTSCTDNRNYYSYNCNNYLQKKYLVNENVLIINKVDTKSEEYSERIFLHDTEKNESREISLKEAQGLKLSGLLTSPDGITVSSNYDRSQGGFPFIFDGGYSSYGYYLIKGKNKSKLNLINNTDQYYYQNNFQFLGWVLPGRD